MARPTHLLIDRDALLHNLQRVRQLTAGKKLIAMVKANAYGCGLNAVIPVLDGRVDAFGVACLEEAQTIRRLGSSAEVILFQGVFAAEEFQQAASQQFSAVLHASYQVRWLLDNPLAKPIKIWIKVNTGMNRLGFMPDELPGLVKALKACAWVNPELGLMTHFASADEPDNPQNEEQIQTFQQIDTHAFNQCSLANSAAILNYPEAHADVVRPGVMLYGVSPFVERTGAALGLKPVMHFISALTAIHHYPPHASVGYGGRWNSSKPCVIGIVAAGYGDGYPRHIAAGTRVWLRGYQAEIVGHVSMDMMAIDLTDCPNCQMGDPVELWGKHIPVEQVARSAGTIAYELICQVSERVR